MTVQSRFVHCCSLSFRLRRLSAAEPYVLHSFKKLQLSDQFFSEGATFADFNRDGAMDVVSGPYWYAGPKFTERHEYLPAEAVRHRRLLEELLRVHPRRRTAMAGPTSSSSASPARRRGWFDNPQGKAGHWERHVDAGGDRQRVADVHRRHRRRRAGARLQHRRPAGLRRDSDGRSDASRGQFHRDLAEQRLSAVHARPGRRRRERRRPHRRAGEGRLVGAAGGRCEGRVRGRFTR